jgi:hypothetical protein
VDPWKLSVRCDSFVSNDVQSEYESVCNDLESASDSDIASVISAVMFSTVATIQGLQQYASEGL